MGLRERFLLKPHVCEMLKLYVYIECHTDFEQGQCSSSLTKLSMMNMKLANDGLLFGHGVRHKFIIIFLYKKIQITKIIYFNESLIQMMLQ